MELSIAVLRLDSERTGRDESESGGCTSSGNRIIWSGSNQLTKVNGSFLPHMLRTKDTSEELRGDVTAKKYPVISRLTGSEAKS